jgi:hypothetical protein
MKRIFWLNVLILMLVVVLAGCNYPPPEENGIKGTAVAETVAASIAEETQKAVPTDTPAVEETDTEHNDESSSGDGEEAEEPTKTPTSDPEGNGQIGDDKAEFIADVSIPDYSEVESGEEITKTWRIRNNGTTTWSTDYVIEFEKGEKLGAPTQLPLPKEVKPGGMVDISIDFTVPAATGEYSSYWILKNEDNEKVGVEEEGKYLSLFMVIVVVKEGDGGGTNGGSSGSGSISGGAKITGASVTVTPKNYQGSCPADVAFNYTVTTSNAGKVQFNLVFNVISPSGYTFDPPPQYLLDFSGGYTVYYDYLLSSSDPVTATVRVRAVGSNEFLSDPVQFTVKCN